jgi:hypothetical protein
MRGHRPGRDEVLGCVSAWVLECWGWPGGDRCAADEWRIRPLRGLRVRARRAASRIARRRPEFCVLSSAFCERRPASDEFAGFAEKVTDASNAGLTVARHGPSTVDWVQSENRRLTRSPHCATGEPTPRRL